MMKIVGEIHGKQMLNNYAYLRCKRERVIT
jgi:hypothetical protein